MLKGYHQKIDLIQRELKKLSPRYIFLLMVAGIINAFGVTVFIAPVGLYDSGISGTSIFLSQVTPPYLTLSLFLIVLNIPLFLIGLKKQGLSFTIYACYAVACYSVSAWIITDVLPVDVTLASPLAGTDLLLCAIFGGLISGIGSGLAIRSGGAMDGIEVLAVIFAKRLGLSVGTFIMAYNVLLYIASGILLNSWILPLYSVIAYGAALKTVDFIVEGLDRAKAALIVTDCHEEICSKLSKEFGCGITLLHAHGYYSDSEKMMLYIVVNRFQIRKMKDIVHDIDEKAYITMNEVADVFAGNMNQQ